MVILQYFFCFLANLDVSRVLLLLKYYRLIGYSLILFPLNQEERVKMFDLKSTLFITSRFVPKQYTRVQSLLVYLFPELFRVSFSRAL